LVFVGNNEFSLSGANSQETVISSAVADRALYLQTLDYDDVTDDDLRLFVEAQIEIEDAALTLLLRTFRGPRSVRSLRRVADLLQDLVAGCNSAVVGVRDVRETLQLA